MTEESALRKQGWLRTGCNAFSLAKGMPLSFWTEQDIYQYIINNNLAIAKCYGKLINKAGKWETTGEKRTGCMFCPIGVQLEKQPNKFQRMAVNYPKIWNYVINRMKLGELLDYASVPYKPIRGAEL